MKENGIPKEHSEASKQYEAEKPFSYDKVKAQEYGFSELSIEGHEKAQALIDAIYHHDPAFVVVYNGKLTINIHNIKQYWGQNCSDLPSIPKHSSWFFQALAEHRLSNTIDNDDHRNINNPTKPHISAFGLQEFLLVMDWKETDKNHSIGMESPVIPQAKKIMQQLFGQEDVAFISRDTINSKLWEDHDARIHTKNVLAVIQELIGSTQDPHQYELRLMRFDEYVRAAQAQDYGKTKLQTWFDGYSVGNMHGAVGYRFGLGGGYRDEGGAANVGETGRASRFQMSVRLVLSRKS